MSVDAPRFLFRPEHVTGRRFYTAMTKEEEEKEVARVSHLRPEDKDTEIRDLNRKLAKLEMLKGINNGELYTWTGRYKNLVREYAMPMFWYYWALWGTSFVCTYAIVGIGGLDAMEVIGKFDTMSGWNITDKVDPALGKIGLALVLNEMLEPIRLPLVVITLKPLMETLSPPKY
jgi:hypothetical protein